MDALVIREARREGEVLGFGSARVLESESHARWQIQRELGVRRLLIDVVAVSEPFRRRGVGTALVRAIEHWARRNGAMGGRSAAAGRRRSGDRGRPRGQHGRPVIVRIEPATLMFLDPQTRELLRVWNPLTHEQTLRLEGARPAGPPPRPRAEPITVQREISPTDVITVMRHLRRAGRASLEPGSRLY